MVEENLIYKHESGIEYMGLLDQSEMSICTVHATLDFSFQNQSSSQRRYLST